MIITNFDPENIEARHIVGALSALYVLWYVLSAIRVWHRLRNVPGPALASFSHLWLGGQHLRGEIATALRGLQRYGPVVRIGPNEVVTDDPDILAHMAGVRSGYGRHRSFREGVKFHHRQDAMLNILDPKLHDRVKGRTAAGYSGRDNPDFERALDSQLLRLIELIRARYLSAGGAATRPVDFAPLTRYYTLDVITRLAYGHEFGHLDEGTDKYGFVGEVDRALKIVALIRALPAFRALAFSDLGFRLMGPKLTAKRGLGKMMAVAHGLVDRRFEPDAEKRNDMMGSFIKNGLSRDECKAEGMLQIVAGSDGTATTIRGTMMYLMSTPSAYCRLKREIRHALDSGLVAGSPITMDESRRLPYLNAVINEGFRIKNPLTLGHFKVVPPGGDTVGGVFLPGGTAIGHNSVALSRSPRVFGEDVDVFRPERFADAPEEERARMEKALDIMFGGGRWTCAGKTVVKMELQKTVFEVRSFPPPSQKNARQQENDTRDGLQLLRWFDFQFLHPEKPWDETTNITFSHWNMWMRITDAKW
ncbi:hypothetical protein RB597_010413 [Gaeumannomyces tritici]